MRCDNCGNEYKNSLKCPLCGHRQGKISHCSVCGAAIHFGQPRCPNWGIQQSMKRRLMSLRSTPVVLT